jgi:hypothetical protein
MNPGALAHPSFASGLLAAAMFPAAAQAASEIFQVLGNPSSQALLS